MTQIAIRVLDADDAPAWCAVRLEALQSEPEAFSSSIEAHNQLTEDEVRSRLAYDSSNKFVIGAFVDGVLVGTAGFVRESGLKERHKGRVWGVYLRAEHRGKSLGRQMMMALLERARAIAGMEQVNISVTATQVAAVALYRSLGFIAWGNEERALKIGSRYIDEEHMVLPLLQKADPSSG